MVSYKTLDWSLLWSNPYHNNCSILEVILKFVNSNLSDCLHCHFLISTTVLLLISINVLLLIIARFLVQPDRFIIAPSHSNLVGLSSQIILKSFFVIHSLLVQIIGTAVSGFNRCTFPFFGRPSKHPINGADYFDLDHV